MPSKNSSATKQKNDRPKFKFFKSKFTLLFLLTALLGGGTLAAQILPSGFFSSLQNSFGLTANPSPTPQPKRPKKKTQSGEQNRGNLTGGENTENLTTPLASTDFDLIGLAVTVTPATQTVPKNTPTGLLTSVQVPDGTDPGEIIANINPNFRIRGELVGPSLTAPQTLETQIGQILPIPPLAVNGDHQVQNLRVVDIGTAGEPTIAAVSPDSCGITVIDNILVSQVQVNEMTYEQIVQSGINLTNDNYNFFNFTFALATSSGTVPISIPVALPNGNTPNQPPITGAPSTNVPGVPVPDVVPVIFTVEGDEGSGGNQQPNLPSGEPVRIPGAIIFPGRIGLLHQFFEAIVIVSNGAPNGTPLVITNLRAKANLPDNGTPTNEADDPLRIAETQIGGRVSQLNIHGLGPDGRYGTADDFLSFSPGQTGQASFLLEGLKEGLHTVNFDLQGTLNGLPTGAVNIRGQVPGAVLVRDASFGVTFTHPSIVRAGQEYDLGMTVYNSGNSVLNGVSLQLAGNSISGATLIDDELKMLTQSIPRGSSGTVKWRLRANVTGQVTASYVKVGEGINAGLQLVTGVGDRNIPLSPDSLILPDPVRHLPPDVVESARQLLGQGWSVATAPPGALPPGVAPISKQTIINRAVELGFAGLRKDFNEPRDTTIQTLTRDWLGELSPDTGFADAMRNTPAGYYFFDTVGTKFYNSIENGQTPAGLHQLFTSQELSRSTFVSALVTQSSGTPFVGAKLLSPNNEKVGWGANPDERFGELQKGASFNLLANDPHDANNPTRGQMLLVSSPSSGNWKLELTGWGEGTADVSIVAQLSGKNYRQILVSGLNFTADKRYRVTFRSSGTTAPVVEELVNGSYQTVSNAAVVINTLNEPNSNVVGVVQITPDVVGGGDPFGRLVGVLFSKPMDKVSVETIARYQVSGGNLVNSNPARMVGKPIAVKGGAQNFGNRFVILSLDAPVGPFIERKLSVNGLRDTSGKTVIASTNDINMRVSPQAIPPGAYLTGKVMNADGTPVPNAVVQYMTDPQNVVPNRCDVGSSDPQEVARRVTDASGEFQFDYVREGKCLPILLRATNVATNSQKTLVSNILYHGQHIVLNAVYLARGKVRGTVKNGGNPLANAYVNIIAESDLNNSKLVRTDAAGNYEATDVPVGNVTVKAVGSGAFSLASGIGSGTISGPGATAIVNVSTQNISGEVSGKVAGPDANQTPVSGALIVARAQIPGFPTLDPRGTPVGYAYAGQDGNFRITGLPIGNVHLEARDVQTGVGTSLNVQLTTQNPKAQNILIVMPGYGSVSGRVTDEIGQPIPNAQVTAGGQGVVTDSTGNYLLPRLPAGTFGVSARVPALNLSGSTTVTVQNGGETTGADIIIKRPANLTGQIFITENGTTQPLVGAKVTADGYNVVETNSQGRYQINNISAGSYILRVVLESRGLFVNQSIILIAGETLTRNVTLYPGKIHGRITQPDGVTSVIATVQAKTQIPYLMAGAFYGLPNGDSSYQFTSGTDGTYSFSNINPGQYVISTSNVFFPIKSSKTGNLPPNGDHEVNLSLVDSLAGKIQGKIYQPDGTTPVGAGVKVSLGGGSLSDVTVRTDETGHYEFAEVFAAGGYSLTALDPLTGRTNRTGISVVRNQDVIADLRLLGRGSLRVRVIDGAGNPVPNGLIRVNGTNYPNDERFTELTAVNGGMMQFDNLNEGNYAVYGEYIGLSGRNSAAVTPDGVTEVVIQTRASGSITGRVMMPDGITPVGLADVTLSQGGRIIGFISSDDSDENRGKFNFQGVPAGDFTVSVFDNRTARVGRFEGRIIQQGETVNANISLIAQGNVIGQVTSNGVPVDHALVTIGAEGSGIVSVTRIATTDENGNFRFTGIPVGRINISVSNGPGGLTGFATGIVSGTVEPLPDTVLNVALTPSATINGTIYKNGGTEPFTGAKITLYSGNRVFSTTSDLNGAYQVNFVSLGQFRVRAEAPSGFDRGQTELLTINQPGATVTANITMNGLGTITGEARDSDGSLLNRGAITFTNSDWGSPVTLAATVQANGQYTIANAPSGNFALKLTLADRIGVATATGSLAAGQTANVPLQLESAGRIFGNLRQSDGTTPAVGADITLTLARAAGGNYTFFSHSDSQGNWTFDNLPLGTISVLFSDPNTNGIARLEGQTLATNGQIIDTGNIVLDNTPIAVASVVPINNATNIPRNSAVQITFSEPVQTASVNSSSVQIRNGNSAVSANLSISTDGTVVTLTPTASLADVTTYTVVVSTSVKDRNGLSLLEEFRSSFITADETAPSVSAVSPTLGTTQVPVNTSIVVTANEPLAQDLNLAQVVQVSVGQTPVSGNLSLDASGRIITFVPTADLAESTTHSITVNGLRDPSGNVQTQAFSSNFTTLDLTAPTINPLPIDGTTVRNFRPTITATYQDNFAGINISSVVLTLDGNNVTSGATVTGGSLTYTPTANLTRGVHNLTLQIADNAGNISNLRTASFTIDDSGPIVTNFTIGGTPATNGTQVTSSLTPLFEVNYSDDTGINASATKLYLGYNGATPTEVGSTATNTKLTYQSPTQMSEGNYVVRAVITNNLGTSTDTGEISFTLDVDAPDIQSVTPNAGNQHGGTTVVLSGLRLLNSNNTAPVVTIGNASATVTNIVTTTPNQVTVLTPAGVPGDAIIQVNTDRGFGRAAFNYQADPKTPFSVEADTRLLWHLDETGSSNLGAIDSSPFGLHGTSAGFQQVVGGRFSNGRTATIDNRNIQSGNPFGLLNFASTGFTLETWLKTPQVTSQKPIMQLYNDAYGEVGTVFLEASGALTARVLAPNGTQWSLTMPSTTYDVDNNQWHQIAFVLDLTQNKLKLYVDGELRAEAAKPVNFDVLRDHPSSATRLYVYQNLNWTIDEVRASNSPHSAQQILNTYLGTEGNTQTTVYSGNSSIIYPRGTTNNLNLSGYNLAGVTATATDSAGNPVPIQVVNSSATSVNLTVIVGNEAALGNGQIVITSSTNSVSVPFRITDLTRTAPSVEADTRLLWHLDETGSGNLGALDASPFGLHGTSSQFQQVVPGRFSNGRTVTIDNRNIQTSNPFGLLNFAATGFTLETWLKTPQIASQKPILQLWNDAYGEVGTVFLEASGALTARIYAPNSTPWSLTMPSTTYDVDNNQWHQIAFVLDLTQNKLKLYVDGELRAEAAKPVNFDVLRDHPSSATRLYVYQNLNWTIDEVRASNSPHSTETIRQDFIGDSGMRVTSTDYSEIYRESATVINHEFNLFGYNLENVTAQVIKNGQPINVGVSLVSSSFRQAKLNLAVQPDTPLGMAQLVVSKPNYPNSTINLRIVEKNPFVADTDTVLLWHLDETGNSNLGAIDSGALGLHGTSSQFQQVVPGRFSNGRTATIDNRTIQTANPFGALNFGANSVTLETWVKTPQVTSSKLLLQLYNDAYGEVGALNLEASGALSARFFSPNSTQWSIATSPANSDIDNNQWHHIALVIDRTENKLKIYVDGQLQAETAKPANFDMLRDHPSSATRIYVYQHLNLVQDEIRLSSSAFSAERVSNSYYGSDQFRLYRTYPLTVQRNATNQVFITGYGLNNVSVTTNRADVAVNVVSATLSQLELGVTPSASAVLGEVQIILTKPSGENLTTSLSVVDQQPYVPALDTVLLWHLDETGNSNLGAIDSGALGLHGTSSSFQQVVPGRFSNGRTATIDNRTIQTANPFGALNFGANSVTLETWVKTPQVASSKMLLQLYNDAYGEVGALNLEASGALSARFFSPNSTQWSAAVSRSYNPQTGYWQGRIDDNYWHHVAVVIDRTENKLKIYVDGQLQAETAKPANFDMLRDHPSSATRIYAYQHLNLVQDEIRLSSSAFSAERVSESYLGFDQFRLYRTYPGIAQRGVTTQVFVTGHGLNDVSVTASRGDVSVNIVSATSSQLELSVEPILSAEPGNLQLTLMKPSGEFLNTNIAIVNQQPFSNTDTGTKLLWHLDETGNSNLGAIDSGALGLHGTSSGFQQVVGGRFSNGRTATIDNRTIQTANPFGALNFGANSVTLETWVKTPQISGTRNLMQLYNDAYGEVGTVFVEASGALSARFFSPNSTQWSAAVARSYNPQTGYWQGRIDDNYWHHVAVVIDRTENKLKIYVDGQLQAETAKPANFDMLRDHPSSATRIYASQHLNLVQDEIRILDYPRTLSQIYFTWFGAQMNLGASVPNLTQSKPTAQQKPKDKPLPPKNGQDNEKTVLNDNNSGRFRLPQTRGKTLLNRR